MHLDGQRPHTGGKPQGQRRNEEPPFDNIRRHGLRKQCPQDSNWLEVPEFETAAFGMGGNRVGSFRMISGH